MFRASYEDLVKLVKERGTFEVSQDDTIEGVLRIDLSGTGYSKQYNRLEMALKELYPDHEAEFTILDNINPEDDIFKIWLVDKNWRENWHNPFITDKEHWEQKALADIKESAEVILYGDTSLPDAEKEPFSRHHLNFLTTVMPLILDLMTMIHMSRFFMMLSVISKNLTSHGEMDTLIPLTAQRMSCCLVTPYIKGSCGSFARAF